ncbi:hypothetical protein QAD02_004633 [Eretmocerus hayati]|uniref:Uncharacterized protein n=1 Tax=Eretmocerus hayati TaxID=131215 RepID=A0ACC2NQF8_9HYME|nr:hypothetical protein QAD02_004633 [Eretmocerus hayati]
MVENRKKKPGEYYWAWGKNLEKNGWEQEVETREESRKEIVWDRRRMADIEREMSHEKCGKGEFVGTRERRIGRRFLGTSEKIQDRMGWDQRENDGRRWFGIGRRKTGRSRWSRENCLGSVEEKQGKIG